MMTRQMVSQVWVAVMLGIVLSGCSGTRPGNLGIHNGRLAPCPDSPNCVSSTAADTTEKPYIAPYQYEGAQQRAREALKRLALQQPGAQLVAESEEYLYFEFRSRIFSFTDDVEFYLPQTGQRVELRSASRLGYWDMGVNRKRLERLRELFMTAIGT